MASLRFAGLAFLKVDGQQYPLRGNFIVSPSRVERTGVAGQDGVHGFIELPRVPFIEGDISAVPGLSIEDLELITDATVTAEPANGRIYTLTKAWTKGAFDLNTHDGIIKVRFEGVACTEMAVA